MRLQLALNVDDLDAAVDFYSKMFGTEPRKVKPGYANFAIAEPPLKLVLFEGAEPTGSINHLGVEVMSTDEVTAAEKRLTGAGLDTTGVSDTVCCYSEKTETWLEGPDGTRWEWYVAVADIEHPDSACCAAPASGDAATAPPARPAIQDSSQTSGGAPAGCCGPVEQTSTCC